MSLPSVFAKNGINKFLRAMRHVAEATIIGTLLLIFRLLPLDYASATGGWIGRHLGPLTGIHRKALRQIKMILLEHDDSSHQRIVTGMWDNLGRLIAEFPHMQQITRERTKMIYHVDLREHMHADRPAIMISGHFANWEIAGLTLHEQTGFPLHLVYRPPNNPYVDRILNYWRSYGTPQPTIPKSRTGMRRVLEALKRNQKVGILIDQKYNEGIAVPFFGHNAMTSVAFAELGKKFNCPVYPAQVIRNNGAHFTIVIYPPLDLSQSLESCALAANRLLTEWMHQHPEQWLWIHQRWATLEQAA